MERSRKKRSEGRERWSGTLRDATERREVSEDERWKWLIKRSME